MKETTNYNLKKIELTDSPPDITVINHNWDAIDVEMKRNADADDAHKADKANPHGTTKAHVALGSVLNYGLATQAEAEAGTSNVKYMTPLRSKQAIDKHTADNMFVSIQVSRDMSIVGMQQISLGFKPEAVIIFANVDDTKKFSVGQAVQDGQHNISLAGGGSLDGTFRGVVNTAVKISDSTSNFTSGAVSFANDGINITWAKSGSGGTGSARIQIIAFRHKE